MMTHSFDPGYETEPFRTLCENHPQADVYPPAYFRVEWGPIFHRGRLDHTGRILILGQDPAQNENIVRRILVGEAGQRIQGFLAKLGLDRSYVMLNTFLYSVYGAVPSKFKKDPKIVEYRHQWLDALLVGTPVQAVVALGLHADDAWQKWKATPKGQTVNVIYMKITHPTQPESASDGDKTKLASATKAMLANWNVALQVLKPAITEPDSPHSLILYGERFANGDRLPIPDFDFPAGLPAWMREQDNWAKRRGEDILSKRRNITINVPKEVISKML
jgi:uracil-DNA glycosylase